MSSNGDDGVEIPTWDDLKPQWISENIDFLRTFANNPTKTILGAILTAIIAGVTEIWTTILEALQYLWYGDNIATTEGTIGLADLPVVLANIIIDTGGPIGNTILGLVDTMYSGLEGMLAQLGPLAFPVTVAVIVGVLIITQKLLMRLGPALLEAIPVIGPFVKNLIIGP